MSQPIPEVTNELDEVQSTSAQVQKPLKTSVFISIGFIIWLGATLIIQNYGHMIFRPNEAMFAFGLYLVTAIGIIFIARFLFSWQKLEQTQYFQAAILLALPGMILDSIIMVSFQSIFPNLAASTDSALASWLLWAYAFVLISGFIRKGDI